LPQHRFRLFSIKTLVVLGVIVAATSLMAGYQTNQVYNMEVSSKVSSKIFERDVKVTKVATWYMEKNPRLWLSLALYMAEATVAASEEYKVPLKIMVGVITKESEANPFAKSFTGAAGTSQIDFKAHKDTFPTIKTARDRYDPKYNTMCGAYLMQDYIKKYGVKNALHAYNLGENAFKKGKRNPNYVRDVLSNASDFEFYHA
jgi:Ni/Co efflux regulator RcnB